MMAIVAFAECIRPDVYVLLMGIVNRGKEQNRSQYIGS